MKRLNILAVVPARGGSKGIKNKNIIEFAGLPLIAHTLKAINESKYEFDHVVSTDSRKIAAVAGEYGGNVPFLRKKELASDGANVVDVVQDVIDNISGSYDYILLLQPTCPLRSSEDIDACIDLAVKNKAVSVCSFTKTVSAHPHYMYYLRRDRAVPVLPVAAGSRRQSFSKVAVRNGAIYLIKTKAFLREKSFIGKNCLPYLMPTERSVNIDSYDDVRLGEYYAREQ